MLRILLPSLCIFYKVYVHIPYGVFVALEILEVCFMVRISWMRLFFALFKLDGLHGLYLGFKFLFGILKLDDIDLESCIIRDGVSDA